MATAGISSGEMDQKVTPLYPIYSGRTDLGAQSVTWQELSVRWAKVYTVKGQRLLDTGETWAEDVISVTMHYTNVVTPRCRLKWNNRIYEIVSLSGTLREGKIYIKARLIDEGQDSAETTE